MTQPPITTLWQPLTEAWSRLRPAQKWSVILAACLLLLILFLSAPPLFSSARLWRAESLIRTASDLQDQGRLPDALAKAHAAYQLAPTHPPVARALAEIYEAVHSGRARDLWNALLADPAVRKEDRLRAADFFIRVGLLPDAEAALAPLLARPPFPPPVCEAAARLALAQGQWPQAELWTERGLASQPDPELRLRLTDLAIQAGWSQGGRAREEAFAQALETARQAGSRGVLLLSWLAARPELPPAQAAELLSVLEQAGASNSFAAADARLRKKPADAPAIYAAVVAAHQSSSPEEIAEAGRWLNQRGGAAAVPDLISEETARSRRDLFLIRADALALQGQWDQLEKLLQDPEIPVERVFVRAFQFRVAVAQGRDNQAQIFWERALQETNRQPDLLWFLATYAERLGKLDQVEAAYRRLAQDAGAARLAYLAWARLLESTGQTERLRKLMVEIAARYPHEPAPRNDLLYLDLLTGHPPTPRLEAARQQVASDPRVGAYRITLALALLKSGLAEEAVPLFDGFPPLEQWPPGWRAVHAAVLHAAGQTALARELTAAIPRDRLKPEERALLPR